ncbi:MAG: sugar ABC transporter permease [Myxococcota bacterium]|nr:sugar ABC transporter permease [Myxococcota bacterium]
MGLTLAAIWLVLHQASDGLFLTPRNLTNLAVQSSVVGIMACGMVLVIVGRHIDLSVGSVLGFTGMLLAVLQAEWLPLDAAWSWGLGIAVVLAAGAAVGAWQGWWVAYRGVPAFVVTLGGLLVFRGAAYLMTEGRTVAPLHALHRKLGGGLDGSLGEAGSWALAGVAIAVVAAGSARARARRRAHGVALRPAWLDLSLVLVVAALVAGFVAVTVAYERPDGGGGRGVPAPVLILAGVAVATHTLARRTRFGRSIFAMGGSPEAARLAGIDVRRVTLGVFTWMGLLAAVAACITTARLDAGTNSMGTLAELSVIAAAVIGGTSLSGGVGSVGGAILGAVIMQSLESGMVLLGVSSALRQVGIGLVLIVAVWIDLAIRSRGR